MNPAITEAKQRWQAASSNYMRLINPQLDRVSAMAPTPSYQATIDAAKGIMEMCRDQYFSLLFESILEKMNKA